MTNKVLSYSLNNQDLNDIEELRIQLKSSNTNTFSELSDRSFLSSKNPHFEVEAECRTFMRKRVTFTNKQKERKTKQNKTKKEKLEATRKWSIEEKNEGNAKSCEKAHARTSTR